MSVQYLGEHAPTTFMLLPLHVGRVSAGFPSPAQDYIEAPLDLNELCVRHPAATYLVVAQVSMAIIFDPLLANKIDPPLLV